MDKWLALTVLALAFGAEPIRANAAPLSIDGGKIAGTQIGDLNVFKGVPYAAPPTGRLRWRPPQAVVPWRGIRAADAYSPACPQVGNYPADALPEPTSEDCLTLNIWAPSIRGAQRLPVMVWIHGGGLVNGSGSVPQYSGDKLAAQGVLVVTLNYRLGILGFLAHPDLDRESPHGGSGNYGLLDQIAALKWVRRNIAAFGGDPDQVTIFGQSSGGFSVSMLVASPMAKGLFRRAIAQSGGVFEPVELDPSFTPKGASEAGLRFAKKVGARSIADLRNLPADALLKTPFNPQFNIDGHAIPAPPHDAYTAGRQNDVNLLVGSNAAEASFFFDPRSVTVATFKTVLERTYPSLLLRAVGASPGRTDAEARKAALEIDTDMRFRWDMWAWARHASRKGKTHVYLYRFTAQPDYRTGHPLRGLGATHGGELPYVFGQLPADAANWRNDDRALAATIQRYWTNFAKSGDPNGPGLPAWPVFSDRQPRVMELGSTVRASELTDETRLKRIDRVYAVARFVNRHLYGVLAATVVIVVLLLAILTRYLKRFWVRTRSRKPGSGQPQHV